MTPLARFLIAVWLVLGSVVASPVPCMADTLVTTHAANEIRRGVVRLSDLFDGVPADQDHDIAQAPPNGRQAVYDSSILAKLASKYNFEWHPTNIADHVVITAVYSTITKDMIGKAVAQKVKDLGTHGDVDAIFDNRVTDLYLPADQTPDFTLNNFEYDQLSKRFRAELVTLVGQTPYTMPVQGHVSVKLRVPVLVHRLEGGTVIGNADIDWINVPQERVSENVVTDANQLVGRELRRNSLDGELIHTNDVMPPRFVTRGGLVTLKIATPFMMLTAQGKAMQDGTQGETVRVLNTASNRMLEGTVDGPGVVTVPTAQKLAVAQ